LWLASHVLNALLQLLSFSAFSFLLKNHAHYYIKYGWCATKLNMKVVNKGLVNCPSPCFVRSQSLLYFSGSLRTLSPSWCQAASLILMKLIYGSVVTCLECVWIWGKLGWWTLRSMILRMESWISQIFVCLDGWEYPKKRWMRINEMRLSTTYIY